jgi:tRNA A-37 threonylcarbamoyl transferase component Bud32
MRRYLLYARSTRWAELAHELEELIESAAFSALKAEGRVRAGWLEVGAGARVFVKRVATRSALRGWSDRLRGSRARRAMRGATLLEAAGIPHPTPLAALEVRSSGGAIRASYLVSEALEHAQTLSVFALGRRGELRRDLRRRIEITRAVAAAVRTLHDRGLYTHDLQETNLMLETAVGGFRVYFIDLEDFARTPQVPLQRRLLNLVHLDRSVGRFVGRAGRLRFLYAYLDERPSRAEIRRTVGQLLRIRARLDRRASKPGRRESSMPAAVSTA